MAAPIPAIPPSSEPLISGLPNPVATPWYVFLSGLFKTTGSGQSPISLGQMIQYFVTQSIALTVPSWLRVTGSPIAGATGLRGTLAVQSATIPANEVLAGPDAVSGLLEARRLVGNDLPPPTAAALGGVKSLLPMPHRFLTGIDTAGNPDTSQPAFADLSGSIAGAQTALGQSTGANATTGYPGEYVAASLAAGSAVALTNGVARNVTSIFLSPGDWDVHGAVYFAPAGTTVIAGESAGINQVSATLPTPPAGGYAELKGLTLATGAEASLTLGHVRLNLTAAVIVYLVAAASFSVSTCGAYGVISARRSANVH